MDNLDDSENNAKISDSAYSNSCSNSQSRRSHSSKSTHSGSSGSSGYGGKPSTSGSSIKLEQSKKEKDGKKKKLPQTEVEVAAEAVLVEGSLPEPKPLEVLKEENITKDVIEATQPVLLPEKAVDNMDISSLELTNFKNEVQITTMQAITTVSLETSCQVANIDSAGFSCAISMHDGVVMYTTQNLTINLGFPKDMWIGRSFIDFVHPKDRKTFASQITNGLAVPKIVNGTQSKAQTPGIADCTMVCRIRRYRSLLVGFGIKDRTVAYMPFLLKFSFKDINEDDGKIVYLIIQATPIHSGYKTPNECKVDATPFVIRHSAAGLLEYIDIESVPYLGYMPQDIQNMDTLMLYHPDDLPYLKMIYETIVKEGSVAKSMPYRMLSQNGDYVKLETEWSSFINPWSMKLEFVIGKHHVVEGPTTPDVFLTPPQTKPTKVSEEDKLKSQVAETNKQSILKILKDVLTKPAEKAKHQMSKRCHDLALIMESLLEDQPKPEEELRVEIQEPDLNCYERDSVMLGGISPHHEYNDSKSSTETPLSYNQLNYNENLQRYFDSHQNYCYDENNTTLAICDSTPKPSPCSPSNCMFPAQNSAESNDMSSTGSSTVLMCNSFSPPVPVADTTLRLTESILTKHNNDMEKELAKYHREARTISKGERLSDTRQKKKEHLARCNATFQPTMAGVESVQPHGVKRPLVGEGEGGSKQLCTQSRQPRRRQITNVDATSLPTANNTVVTHVWQNTSNAVQVSDVNPYSVGTPQQMPLMPHLPGVFPLYYAPNTEPGLAVTTTTISQHSADVSSQNPLGPIISPLPQYTSSPMPWMHPHPVYGSPYMYSQMAYNIQQQQAIMAQSLAYQTLNPLGLPNNNYTQACKSTLPLRPSQAVGQATWTDIPAEPQALIPPVSKSPLCDTSNNALKRDSETWNVETRNDSNCQATEKANEPSKAEDNEQRKAVEPSAQSGNNSDATMDRTDGESSYSSFYSSFFKTESGSAEDSSDPKKFRFGKVESTQPTSCNNYSYKAKNTLRRKMDPPWMDSVSVTPELVYRYQIQPKYQEEVLQADLEKIKKLKQPSMVNEQLGQLYIDLQLEGVTSRLTLEEGITSSSSSGDETCFSAPVAKPLRRKREYSQMNMIYEEDAPLPPPVGEIEEPAPSIEMEKDKPSEISTS